jgi:integrase
LDKGDVDHLHDSEKCARGQHDPRTNNVRAVLRAAVEDRIITRDPSKGITLPRRRRAESSMAIPSTAEVGTILRVADRPFTAFVGLCAFAGLRLGEAAAVQVSDVDFLRRTLTLSRQVQREKGGGIEIRPPKYGSERIVFLAPALVEILAAHVEQECPGDRPTDGCSRGRAQSPRIRTPSATAGGRP